jgi:hypothetical protein
MAKLADFFSGDGRWLREEGGRLGSSFDDSWLDPAGSFTDSLLCHKHQQALDLRHVRWHAALAPRNPQLRAVFENQLPR